MTTDLRGATHSPAPDKFPSSPGEFAALWNDKTLAERGELVDLVVANAHAAHRCWAAEHVARDRVEQWVAAVRVAARLDALEVAVAALEVAGMGEAARVVDGLAARGWGDGAQ